MSPGQIKSAIHTKRRSDAVISIKQDNNAKKLFISSMNKAAEFITGYDSAELIDKNFSSILPNRVIELLSSYLEYGDNISDFAVVSRKIPNFQILTKNGDVISVNIKVYNVVSTTSDIQEYEILMRDVTLIKKIEELKDIMVNSENKIADKDPDTMLPNINSIVHALDTCYGFLQQYASIEVCFILYEVSNLNYYDKTYGKYTASELIGTFGNLLKKCCRAEDLVGYMGNNVLGMILIDCNLEGAKFVISRVKQRLSSGNITLQNGKVATLTLRTSYTQINKSKEMLATIDSLEAGLDRLAELGEEGTARV